MPVVPSARALAPDAISDDPIQTWQSSPVAAGVAAARALYPAVLGDDPIQSWSSLHEAVGIAAASPDLIQSWQHDAERCRRW
eukprot:3996332-Amphidinium_carterae.1